MKFEDEYLPQIISRNSGIYRDILSDINIQTNQIFIRCINLFALEANCHFERNYLISKALSSVCLNKEQKNAEKEAFAHINVFNDGEHKYQDYLVKGYADILPLYNYTAVDAKDIYDISHLCNYIINTVTNMFFNVNKNEHFTLEMSKEAEKFFDSFIGNGQHINEKSLSEFKTKDFRELYK